ncbi:MAG TPA: hypothetical protein PLU49_00330 [Saprospiraceae bacterium]|nr:hypothetical protein [Saprospiraceae bacterium]
MEQKTIENQQIGFFGADSMLKSTLRTKDSEYAVEKEELVTEKNGM